jgi:hypothetical protein
LVASHRGPEPLYTVTVTSTCGETARNDAWVEEMAGEEWADRSP